MSAIIPTASDGVPSGVLLLSPDEDDGAVDILPEFCVCPCPVRPGHVVAGHVSPKGPREPCTCGMAPPHFPVSHETVWHARSHNKEKP